ncbi:MAG: hypothetical protein R2695_04265 [Acidimicrobiales bacterium]
MLGPLAESTAGGIARLFGVHEQLGERLRRVHCRTTRTAFRVRQVRDAAIAFAAATCVAVALQLPPLPAALAVVGLKPRCSRSCCRSRASPGSRSGGSADLPRAPVVAEQLGMLLTAGWSLRLRSTGSPGSGAAAAARDLGRVTACLRQGVDEVRALREWSDLVEVDALDRLVAVLALNQETPDLGRLVAEEARRSAATPSARRSRPSNVATSRSGSRSPSRRSSRACSSWVCRSSTRHRVLRPPPSSRQPTERDHR